MSLEDVRAIREKKRQRRRAQKQVGDVKVSHIDKRERSWMLTLYDRCMYHH